MSSGDIFNMIFSLAVMVFLIVVIIRLVKILRAGQKLYFRAMDLITEAGFTGQPIRQSMAAQPAGRPGIGVAKLFPGEIVFANGATEEVLVIPRSAITSVATSSTFPTPNGERKAERKLLVVTFTEAGSPQPSSRSVWLDIMKDKAARWESELS